MGVIDTCRVPFLPASVNVDALPHRRSTLPGYRCCGRTLGGPREAAAEVVPAGRARRPPTSRRCQASGRRARAPWWLEGHAEGSGLVSKTPRLLRPRPEARFTGIRGLRTRIGSGGWASTRRQAAMGVTQGGWPLVVATTRLRPSWMRSTLLRSREPCPATADPPGEVGRPPTCRRGRSTHHATSRHG